MRLDKEKRKIDKRSNESYEIKQMRIDKNKKRYLDERSNEFNEIKPIRLYIYIIEEKLMKEVMNLMK